MEPFVALMRRYCVDYTNSQDLSVCDEIMDPGYTLHMGGYHLVGRDEAYKPATVKQFQQFPGLCLTVHEIVTSDGRLAMRFSEHGASVRHGGNTASWAGLGLYRWDGRQLVENFVEQDYFSRRRQLAAGPTDSVEAPAVAPWDQTAQPPTDKAEAVVRQWLDDAVATDVITKTPGVTCDEGVVAQPVVDACSVEVDDLFSAGSRVGFHAALRGSYVGGLGEELPDRVGADVVLHVAGLVDTAEGQVISGRVIRDRLGVYKALRGSR